MMDFILNTPPFHPSFNTHPKDLRNAVCTQDNSNREIRFYHDSNPGWHTVSPTLNQLSYLSPLSTLTLPSFKPRPD